MKGTSGYQKSTNNAQCTNASCTVNLDDNTPYLFEVSGTVNDNETAISKNVFKRDPGFAGLVTHIGSGHPEPNVKVEIYSPTGVKLGTVYTDQDGFYSFNYKHSGKAATYTVKLPVYNLEQPATLKTNSWAIVNFQIP
jgi:hypothetical protein